MDIFLVHSVGPCPPYNEAEAINMRHLGILYFLMYSQSHMGLIYLLRYNTPLFNISALAGFYSSLFCSGKGQLEKGKANFYIAD